MSNRDHVTAADKQVRLTKGNSPINHLRGARDDE